MTTTVICGVVDKDSVRKFTYLAFHVPPKTKAINISYEYDGKEDGRNVIEVGVVTDPKPFAGEHHFRGWSGDTKPDGFTIGAASATPGYVAGPIASPGTWFIIVAPYFLADPQVEYVFTITFEQGESDCLFRPTPAPSSLRRNSPAWYRGDLHVHSEYSDGKYSLHELVELANGNGLDFFFSTEHNTFSANLVWGKELQVAHPSLLVGRGIEVTTRYGHWNALGLETAQWVEFRYAEDADLTRAIESVHDNGGIAVLNHPYDLGLFCDWQFGIVPALDALEVWNGRWKRNAECVRNIRALELWDSLLKKGHRLGAVGGSDAHQPGDVVGLPQTVVHADELTTCALTKGIRDRKVYLVAQKNQLITFTVEYENQVHGIGSQVRVASSTECLELSLETRGFPTDAIVEIYSHKGLIYEHREEILAVSLTLPASGCRYLRAEIRDRSTREMLGLTNPIWID
ncbi:hypothetical protein TRVA0_005S00936 [Trichomonascus vanleenenianus]|uniref:uncharacterized protein n=1 Tax=Trichomonascus vanleenenianus TaxID=2268995 RepID=UPI003ECA01B3